MPLTKLYWGPHVEELKQEFFTVKSMGTATAEEWLKGLSCRGKERRSDASRWENWAMTGGGLKQMRNILYPGHKPFPASLVNRTVAPVPVRGLNSLPQIPGLGMSYDCSHGATSSVTISQQNGAMPDPFHRSSVDTTSPSTSRVERTKEQIAELKAARKAEIEKRALELDPPISANVLAQIPSFQAALQIFAPMDDNAWETLKPRLLAQRADAEKREMETATRVKREADEKKASTTASKEVRDAEDADWDEIQAPVRARIAGYADESIRDGWEDGDKVSKDNCSRFAVEVLVYIRKRFYAEVTKDAAAARAAGKPPVEDPPLGPFTQKLTLENMKWIFDVKVKPHTERYRKEIFLCNGCDVTVRYYGFEGVIQHYAAKHTNALSIGNVVVHWRAEWPEHPPFTWESKPAKNGQHQNQQQSVPGYNAYSQMHQQPWQPPSGGPTSAPGYGPPSWNDHYGQAPQASYPAVASGFPQSQGHGTSPYPADPYASFPPPSQGQQHGAYPGAVPPGATGSYNYNFGAYQNNNQVGYQAVQPAPFSPQYRTQLAEMARIARELWNATNNMKDTLSIIRVQVVVFHLAKRFHAKFGIPLPLALFIDGLSNHKDMRPVRNVNGLICRVCHHGVGGYVASDEERKSYSLPQLIAHFQAKHVDPFAQMGQYGQPPEWTVDMVLLPEPSVVPNLRAAVSMDGQKYHLVNEAVPHLLGASGASGTSQAATTSAWQHHSNYYQGYQGAAADGQQPYYGQSQTSNPTQEITAAQYQNAAVPTAQHQPQPALSYGYSASPPAAAILMPPTSLYPAPEPASVAQNKTTGRGSDNEGRPPQSHPQARDQNHRNSKKNKKKGGNVRDNDDAEAKKREEEETKMAEEEAEREGDVIRAMWAADRANAARKSVLPESEAPLSAIQNKTDNNNNNRSGKSSRPSSKPGTPQPRQRFQSKPPRDSPRRVVEGPSTPMDNQDASRLPLVPPPAQRISTGHRNHQLSNVTYIDGGRDEPSAPQRDGLGPSPPGGYERYERPASVRPMDQRRRSRSPVYIDLSRQGPSAQQQQQQQQQYRQRTPPRQYQQPLGADRDPGYHQRQPSDNVTRPSALPLDDVRYERAPPPPHRDEYVPRDDYHLPREYAGPALIEYEIIEYRNPDGTTWIEERPLRRIPQSESERYYRDAAYAHAPPPPHPHSVSYDRGGEPAAHRHGQTVAPPSHRSPPSPAGAREAYHYGSAYNAPLPSSYSRAPPPPQSPVPASITRSGNASAIYEYDPRRPSAEAIPSSSSRNPPPRATNGPPPPAGYYRGGRPHHQQQQVEDDGGDDDYDPRFPAAPPSAVGHGAGQGPTHGHNSITRGAARGYYQ